ncbi:MAG: glucosaminidase domain-containing protein [Opitutaceae bacterium]|nr:glucosaminidase domain-containing protein [Opitutaceae bacterium]
MNPPTATPGAPAGWLRRTVRARRVLAGAVVIGAGAWLWTALPHDELPAFGDYKDTSEKKTAFFDFLLPQIRAANEAILRDRHRLLGVRAELADDGNAGFFDEHWTRELAENYGLEPPGTLNAAFADRLLLRVDAIAPSLVLAQAANESAWGTSRFARHGNNLFGLRTYDGEGLVPHHRAEGKTFKVAAYPSVRASIKAYMANLNMDFRYRHLRQIRAEQRRQQRVVSGLALANGLLVYSSRGPDYVAEIQSIIRTNKLSQYDELE